MHTPPDYIFALDSLAIEENFPNLNPEIDFEFTSLQTEDYNCICWAEERDDDWIQFYDVHGRLIRASERYIAHFEEKGFVRTADDSLQEGIIKIAIYIKTSTNHFKHVARQLPSGEWTSKQGDWEDIKHKTANCLLGLSYGDNVIFMERQIQD